MALPVSLVIVGATGDLTARKLVPSLYNLCRKKRLPPEVKIIGVARTPLSDDSPATSESPQEGVGGSGLAGTGQAQTGELSGEVVRVQGDQLWLRHGGSVFPLALTEDTRFTPDRRQALRPGQEVRASYTLGDEGYVVNALEPLRQAPEQGASGKEQKARPPDVPER